MKVVNLKRFPPVQYLDHLFSELIMVGRIDTNPQPTSTIPHLLTLKILGKSSEKQ